MVVVWDSVDLVRCSITFDNWDDMKDAIYKFDKRVSTYSKKICIKKILRIKNGFYKFKDMSKIEDIKLSDCEYNDIKLNVLISNDDNSVQIIGEIQLLLDFMSKVKEQGHSLYSLVRRKEFIDNIQDINKNTKQLKPINMNNISNIHDNDGNDNKKIINDIINKRNFDQFKDYILSGYYSVRNDYTGSKNDIKNTLLYQLLNNNWYKAAQLLLANMYHINKFNCNNNDERKDERKDNTDDDSDNIIKQYLNFKNGDGRLAVFEIVGQSLFREYRFFGIKLKNLTKERNNNESGTNKIISSIIVNYFLDSKLFDEILNEQLICHCIINNAYVFFKLLLKYRNDDTGMINGINCKVESYGNAYNGCTPLGLLLQMQHCDSDWINLLLSCKNIDINIKSYYHKYRKECTVKEIASSNKQWLTAIETFEKEKQKGKEKEQTEADEDEE